MAEAVLLPRRQMVLGAALAGMGVAGPAFGQVGQAASEPLEALKKMLDAYEKAFSAQDAPGVVKLFAPNAIVVGTGPGEVWGGAAEITATYRRFFELFDAGKQKFEALFRDGHLLGEMAWLVSMSKVTLTKGADTTEFGLNVSVVFERSAGTWQIRALHFSNLTSAAH